jgi:hypothetical protein
MARVLGKRGVARMVSRRYQLGLSTHRVSFKVLAYLLVRSCSARSHMVLAFCEKMLRLDIWRKCAVQECHGIGGRAIRISNASWMEIRRCAL